MTTLNFMIVEWSAKSIILRGKGGEEIEKNEGGVTSRDSQIKFPSISDSNIEELDSNPFCGQQYEAIKQEYKDWITPKYNSTPPDNSHLEELHKKYVSFSQKNPGYKKFEIREAIVNLRREIDQKKSLKLSSGVLKDNTGNYIYQRDDEPMTKKTAYFGSKW